jgi:hypothetical protein
MIQGIFIGGFMMVLAVVGIAFLDCLLKRPPRWRWWLLFILLGFCPTTIDLARGQITIAPFSGQIVAVSLARDTSAETVRWLLTLSLPLGAMLWLRKNQFWGSRRNPGTDDANVLNAYRIGFYDARFCLLKSKKACRFSI